jgi:predicted amidohydrolase
VRSLTAAIIHLDATPAPAADRLARAERSIVEAARSGAQLIALPELFNIGYTYSDENYRHAETLNGATATWMKNLAARLKVHLAGSILLIDRADIYNALLLFAPDGKLWRYDKHYPWGWERAYFREGHDVTVAQTDLGAIGLMMCWDLAHPAVWRRYAGQVDLMLISSCPPDVSNPTLCFPNGERITFDQMGPLFASMKNIGQRVFVDGVRRQAAWLHVPVVHAAATGTITTAIPQPRASLLAFAPFAPRLIKHFAHAGETRMTCDLIPCTAIVDANGQPCTGTTTHARLTLADEPPSPIGRQPDRSAPWLAYFASDVILTAIARSAYARHRR